VPNEFQDASYDMVKHAKNPLKRSPVLPPSKGESVQPNFLLHHENHFDPNTFTPDQVRTGDITKA
jgi:hypothetical protein